MKIVDMHCDTISELLQRKRAGQESLLRRNTLHLDLERMRDGGYLLQNFALYVNKESCKDPWEEVCALYQVYGEEMEKNRDMIAPAFGYEDIVLNEKAGKMSAMLTVEEGAVCKGDIKKLHTLYDMGVRMLTLTWNYPNELGFPNMDSHWGKNVWKACREIKELRVRGASGEEFEDKRKKVQEYFDDYFFTPNTQGGLTEKGCEFVTRMEALGMIVDVSHLSDAGFYDVLEITKKPFVASHSNARGVCGCVRNLSDDMIRKLAERGGCTGLNFCADFLKVVPVGEPNPGVLEDVVRHALHITKVGGIEVLGLGSDFDGIDTNEALPGAQSMGILWDSLHKAGYRQSELDKIFGENVLRVYKEVL